MAKKSHRTRNIIIVAGVILLLAIMSGGLAGSGATTGTPNQVGSFTVTGDRTKGYTAFSLLKDARQSNIVSTGTVALAIYDIQSNTVHSNTFQLRSADFGQYQNVVFGGKVWGYQWSIDPSQVKPSAVGAFGVNHGSAKLAFATTSGTSLSAIDTFANLANA